MQNIVTNKTIEEINSFWAPFHDKERVSKDDLGGEDENLFEKGCYASAQELRKNIGMFKLFFLMEANFDIDKANETMKRITKLTKLAEYLQMKFADDDIDKAMVFINLIMDIDRAETLIDLFSELSKEQDDSQRASVKSFLDMLKAL